MAGCRVVNAPLLLLPVLFWWALQSAGQEVSKDSTAVALDADEQCNATGGEECALNAMQLRSQKVDAAGSAASSWGSCNWYHCGAAYNPQQGCQCNAHCQQYGNCCADYATVCQPAQAGSAIHGHPSPQKSYPTHEGFTLVLVEEFDSPLDLDNDPIWTWSDGGLREGKVRFVKEAIRFEDGKMKIEVSNTLHVQTQTCSHAEVGEIGAKPMTSGEMRTRHNMFRYGRYEASIKAPSVGRYHWINGNYVSTMFVFRDAKFHHWREIDFEITGDSPGSVTTNVLSADNTQTWRANMAESAAHRTGKSLRSAFHTYAIEWLPDRISWYIDGQLIREKRDGGQVPISDYSAKIMMNLWVFNGGGFGGKELWNNHYPMQSEYDWFRFYKWDGDAQYPCPGLDTSCLSSEDRYLSSNNPCDKIPQVGDVFGQPPCQAHCR